MKKVIVILFVLIAFVSCKNNESKNAQTAEEGTVVTTDGTTVTGSFMYYDDASVFQTQSELFGVVENEKLQDLILQAETLKTEDSDEVAVILKVKKSKKPENEEGWDNRIEILEIIKVSKGNPKDNNIIKLGKETEVL
ncbi:MAG: hypothetical protein ACSHXF_03665 [Aquaticitalea sp.]